MSADVRKYSTVKYPVVMLPDIVKRLNLVELVTNRVVYLQSGISMFVEL
jgi:hypothetical protein